MSEPDWQGMIQGVNKVMLAGLKSGEEIGASRALGKVVDEINRMLDAVGVSGDYNPAFRDALTTVRAYILAELRSKP